MSLARAFASAWIIAVVPGGLSATLTPSVSRKEAICD
jgi:hypothetical protein